MTKNVKSIAYGILYIAIAAALILAVWAVAAAAVDSVYILPGIGETFKETAFALGRGEFWRALGGTLLRGTMGFCISAVLALVTLYLGIAFCPFERVIAPIVSFLRSLPAVAVTVLLSITVGGFGTPIIMGVLVIFPMLYSAAKGRLSTVPIELREVCRICGANKPQTFAALYMPCLAGALPDMLSSAFSYNIKTVIGAEILAQTAHSLGMLMKLAGQYYETAMLIAYVIAAVAICVALELAIRFALKTALAKYAE